MLPVVDLLLTDRVPQRLGFISNRFDTALIAVYSLE
jgi:hypothetical protein